MKKAAAAAAMLALVVCSLYHRAHAAVATTPQSGLTQSTEALTPPRILIAGVEFRPAAQPQWKDGIAFVAASRDLADSLGAILTTGGEPLAAIFTAGGNTASFTEGSTTYTYRDVDMVLPLEPFQQGGYLMIPAVELFTTLGFDATVDQAANTIVAKQKGPSEIVPRDLLSAIFAAPGEQAPATAQKPAAPLQAAGPLEYTFDNTISFDNTAVSGQSDLSNLTRASAINNLFNLRLQKAMANGYTMSTVLRTTETTDSDYNMGRTDKLAVVFKKGGISLSLHDFSPKFSYYTLKNYMLRGAQYTRSLRGFSWTALWGKSPKILADSEYARFVQGFRISRSRAKDREFAASFVRTRDAGSSRTTGRYDNAVFALNASGRSGKKYKLMGELAQSWTNYNDLADTPSIARTLQAQYRDRQTLCTAIYDRTGSEFDSETTYFTAGRRELSTLCNRKINKRTMAGAGFKTVLLGAEETRTIPLLYSFMPLKARPDMKFTLQKNFEKAMSEYGARLTDTRTVAYSDTFGKIKLDANVDRRKQKDQTDTTSFRNSHRFRMDTMITKKTELLAQVKRELRTRGSNPRTRFMQIRFDHELKAWNDLTMTFSRYYNGTANNRFDGSVGYRKVNIETDTEISAEYRYLNYRDHNDNVIKLSYSFLK